MDCMFIRGWLGILWGLASCSYTVGSLPRPVCAKCPLGLIMISCSSPSDLFGMKRWFLRPWGGLVLRKAFKPRGHSSHLRSPCGTRLIELLPEKHNTQPKSDNNDKISIPLLCSISRKDNHRTILIWFYRWVKKNKEVKCVVEALDDIEDIVTKEALIDELKNVRFNKCNCIYECSHHSRKILLNPPFINISDRLVYIFILLSCTRSVERPAFL